MAYPFTPVLTLCVAPPRGVRRPRARPPAPWLVDHGSPFIKRPMRIAVLLLGLALVAAPLSGQAPRPPRLTIAMTRVERELRAQAAGEMERTGTSFLAAGAEMGDTVRDTHVDRVGWYGAYKPRSAHEFADSIRGNIARANLGLTGVSVVGVMLDSTTERPSASRRVVSELQDRWGRCRRVERSYRFSLDAGKDRRRMVFGPARVTRCRPRRYWGWPTPGVRPGRVRVRRPLRLDSSGSGFGIVGRLWGRMVVREDRIDVALDSLTIRHLGLNAQTPWVDSLTVGVASGDSSSWEVVEESRALKVGRIFRPGDTFRHGPVRFRIRHAPSRPSEDCDWIAVTIYGHHRASPGAALEPVWWYVHGTRGMLVPEARARRGTASR